MKRMTVLTLSAMLLTTVALIGNDDINILKNGSFEIVNEKGKVSNWVSADWGEKE
jgi:hypothetical protein